ncbi:hypothetical protein RY27_23555, partial [Litorilinea aerophila]
MFKKQYWLLAVLLILSLLIGACSGPAPAAEAPAGSGAAGQAAAPAQVAAGSSQLPVDVPRQDLFVMDQIFRYSVIDNYNFWINGPHEPHRHALMMETLW